MQLVDLTVGTEHTFAGEAASRDAVLDTLVALADHQMAVGELDEAWATLEMAAGAGGRNLRDPRTATVVLMQAEIDLVRGRGAAAQSRVSEVAELNDDVRTIAHVAVLAAKLEEEVLLEAAASRLRRKLGDHGKAYALMVEGLLAHVRGNFGEAEQSLKKAIEAFDLWMLHSVLADLYDALDMTLEARLERGVCTSRPGEAVTVWINRVPTCRYLAHARELV